MLLRSRQARQNQPGRARAHESETQKTPRFPKKARRQARFTKVNLYALSTFFSGTKKMNTSELISSRNG
ncbi:MAG: hypothetical protein PEGG_00086 [Paraeggerthella hongkongensis]